MIDSLSTSATANTGASSPLDVLAGKGASPSVGATTAVAGRTVTDNVDLSQTAKLAADYRANAGSGDQSRSEQLADSLKQAKAVTDSFAAQLKAGRDAATSQGGGSAQGGSSMVATWGGGSASSFNDIVRQEVFGILKEGKPSDLISRVVKRLFG